MVVAEAYSLIARAIDAGRVAHGYLVVGDLCGQCDELVERVLRRLFPDAADRDGQLVHPDVVRLEPVGRSRTIKVERGKDDAGPGMRDGLIEPMAVTAFSGGWKAGVVAGADRLQPAAANAFLKLLEEPPPKTLFLLLTDAPDAILPTIVSRTQRIDLPLSSGVLDEDEAAEVAAAFAARDGARLAAAFGALKEGGGDAAFVRKRFFRTLLGYVRRMMLGGKLPEYQAFRNIEAVEEAYRQSDRALNDEAVLSFLMDRIVFP